VTTDTRAIGDAVRRFLGGAADDDLAQPVGVAASWRALWSAARDPHVHQLSQSADVDQLDIIEATDDRATVALDAVVHTRWRDDRGGRLTGESLQMVGPVTLELRGGDWRVTDYSVDGRPVSLATRFDPPASQEHQGVRMKARGVHLGGRATSVVLEVENGRGADLDVLWCVLHVPGRLPAYRRLRLLSGTRVDAEGTALVGAGIRIVLPLSTRSVRIVLLLRDRETRKRIPFLLDVDLEDGEVPMRPQPPPSRLPVAVRLGAHWHAGTAALVAMAAAIAYLAVREEWGTLGILSLAYGAIFILMAGRAARRAAPRSRAVVIAGIVLIAIGVALLVAFPDSRQFTLSAAGSVTGA